MGDFGHELHYFARWLSDETFPVRAASADFWRSVCPDLHITDTPFHPPAPPLGFDPTEVKREAMRVCEDGYFHTGAAIEPGATAALADGVRRVIEAGFHPLFVSVFDEFWTPLSRLGALLEPVLGGPPRLLGDYWIWCVGPGQAPAGWAPHRDHEVNGTLGVNGRPTLITVWIPFTDATPENSCIYALPTSLDPNLPFQPQVREVPRVQDVVALPARAGSVVGWNQMILHWGGRCSPHAPHPRISMGIYFQSSKVPDYRKPVPFDAPLPFDARLELIAQAFARYHPTFKFPQRLLQFVTRYVGGAPG